MGLPARTTPTKTPPETKDDDVAVEEESQALLVREQLACHLMKMRHWHVTQASGSEARGLEVPRKLTHLINVGKVLATLSDLPAPHRALPVSNIARPGNESRLESTGAPRSARQRLSFRRLFHSTHSLKRKNSHVGPFSALDLTEPSAASASPTH
jgi:hypothetical protein